MSKLIRIIVLILLAFALSSLLIFRLRIGDTPPPSSIPQSAISSDVQTAEGQVGAVDTNTRTLTLVDGNKEVTFAFDDRTAIVESGRAVPPASIRHGVAATVRYSERDGRNWARKIEILADE